MKADSIDYRYGSNGSYVLTIDGKEIGVVHDLEHAELIAEISNRDEIARLESEVSRLKIRMENELDNFRNATEAYKISLKKINDLSSIVRLDPSQELVNGNHK